jgi:putative DNA primase/helicase
MLDSGDIVDWLAAHENMGREELVEWLEQAFQRSAEQRRSLQASGGGSKNDFSNVPNWNQSDITSWLCERYRPQLAWNVQQQEWYRYSAETEGIWSKEPKEFVGRLVKTELEAIASVHEQAGLDKPSYTAKLINDIISLLKLDLAVRQWDEAEGLLPLKNGLLDLKTYELRPHSPAARLTWCLPYEYNPLASCEPIQEWLLEMCQGDHDVVQFFRAYLNGVVRGRTDLHAFLEMVGSGGTGKSTLIRLAMALVGQRNTHTTTLQKLENSRFETASILGKRLVVITDSERYAGSVDTLKALTGQDPVPYEVKFKQGTEGFIHEVKFKQGTEGFIPEAMVILAANEVPQSSNYTSGLERRRKSVPMNNRISGDKQKNLIQVKGGELSGEFVSYIPGLLNWVLEMSDEEVTGIVKDYLNRCPGLQRRKAETLIETNPIADWLDYSIVYRENYRCNVGVAARDKSPDSSNWYQEVSQWLYANYAEYCHNTGAKAIGVRRFVNLLSDLCKNQLQLNVGRSRDRNGSFFLGLKIREQEDQDSLLISNVAASDVSTGDLMTDSDGCVTDSVMDKSPASDECDRCDGLSEIAFENSSIEQDHLNFADKDISKSDPSHPSQSVTAGDREPSPIHHSVQPHPSQQPHSEVEPEAEPESNVGSTLEAKPEPEAVTSETEEEATPAPDNEKPPFEFEVGSRVLLHNEEHKVAAITKYRHGWTATLVDDENFEFDAQAEGLELVTTGRDQRTEADNELFDTSGYQERGGISPHQWET